MFCDVEFHKPARIPRIPWTGLNSDWQPANLETAESRSTRALVTEDCPESLVVRTLFIRESESGFNGLVYLHKQDICFQVYGNSWLHCN